MMNTEELSRKHTGEDLQVDPTSLDSETSSLYDDDEKQLVTPPLTSKIIETSGNFLPS